MDKGYSFLLKNTNLRLYNRIAYIISFLNFLFFIYLAYFAESISGSGKIKAYVFVLVLIFCFEWLYKKFYPGMQYYFTLNYTFLIIGWAFIYTSAGMVILHLLLAALDILIRQNILLGITNDAIIQQQGILKKKYNWDEFSNIIMKDGLLTLDFKNNKIRYYDIDEQVNETEFNHFCRQRLDANPGVAG